MRINVTRFTCDAPDCNDVVDVESPPDSPVVAQVGQSSGLPDGWIEFGVIGATVDGTQRLVHASTPKCAASMAKEQVADAVKASEQRAKDEEEKRVRAEKAMETVQKNEAKQQEEQRAEKD